MLEFSNLEKFRDLVLASDSSFLLKSEMSTNSSDWFIQGRAENAKLVYGVYLGRDPLPGVSDEMQLIAVEADRTVYLVLPVYNPDSAPLPAGMKMLSDLCEKLDKQVLEIAAQYKTTLPPADPSEVTDLSRIPLEARKLALDPQPEKQKDQDLIFSKSAAVALLAGEAALDDVASNYCQEHKKPWTVEKRRAMMIQEYLDRPGVIEPWEYAMSDALRNVDAQFVLLELGWPGNTVSAKIEPGKVMERLVESGAFRSYDFAVEKSGAKILKALSDTTSRDKDHFYCKDVQRIMLRGTAIYNRDAIEG